MKLVTIQSITMWTGNIDFQTLIEIPDTLDLQKEESAWFANGGGVPQDFVDHLITKGAKPVTCETWIIQYQ